MSDYDKSWLIPVRENPNARLRLFLFHYAAGAASIYRTWGEGLPEDIEIFALQLPGRETRMSEPLLTSIPVLVQNLHRVMRPLLDKPWVSFGHSMGCVLSFELLRSVRRAKERMPLRYFGSGRRGPGVPSRHPDMHTMTDAELLEALRQYGGTPEEILNEPDFMAMLYPIIRADFQALETHVFADEAPLEVPFSIYCGRDDERATPDELEDWKDYSSAECEIKLFDGGHFYINTHRHQVLEMLSRDLETIRA